MSAVLGVRTRVVPIFKVGCVLSEAFFGGEEEAWH